MLDHDLLPGRTENLPDEESPRGRSSPGRRPTAVLTSGGSIDYDVRWDGTVPRPAAGTPVEQRVAPVGVRTAHRIRVDVSRARECRECNGWGSLVEDGRAELCPMCQCGRRATQMSDAATVVLSGEIDTASAPGVEGVLCERIAAGVRRLVVDLDHVVLMDTTAVNVLARAAEAAADRGIQFRVRCARPRLSRLFRMPGIACTAEEVCR